MNKDKIIESFIEHDFQLFISMDSPDEEELVSLRVGCNPKLIKKNITKMKAAKRRPFIICTIQEENINSKNTV